MRILHILSKDVTTEQEARFLRLMGVLLSVDHQHAAVSAPLKKANDFMTQNKIPCDTQKFGGMFDLRTKKAFDTALQNHNPHIIISHSRDSASFVHMLNKDIPHIAMISGDGADRDIAASCDHTIMIGEKTKDEDILKTALSRFEKVLKKYETQ